MEFIISNIPSAKTKKRIEYKQEKEIEQPGSNYLILYINSIEMSVEFQLWYFKKYLINFIQPLKNK